MANIQKKKFKIEGMDCSSCAVGIDFALEDLPGITKAHTNYAKHETEVEFDTEKIQTTQILAQIKKTGYKASELL